MSTTTPVTAHQQAAARHAELHAAAEAKQQKLATARAARQALIDAAARGDDTVTVERLAKADAAIATAGRDAELADATAAAGRRVMDRAEIDQLRAEAAAITEAVRCGYAELHDAADALDRAISEAQARLTALQDGRAKLVALSARAGLFAGTVTAAARGNSILAGLPPNEVPRVGAVATAPGANGLRVGLIMNSFGGTAEAGRPAASFVTDVPRPGANTVPSNESAGRPLASWSSASARPGPTDRCSSCGNATWWETGDGSGGCAVCRVPTRGGVVRFGMTGGGWQDPIVPPAPAPVSPLPRQSAHVWRQL